MTSLSRRWAILMAVLAAPLLTAAAATSAPAVTSDPAAAVTTSATTATPPTATPATASVRTSKGGPQYRLPETVVPQSYVITMNLDLPTEDSFNGTVKIAAVAVRKVNFVTLHVDHAVLNVTKATLQDSEDLVSINTDTTAWTKNKELQTLTLPLTGDLAPGKAYTISITFNGSLRRDMYGFYRSEYTAENTTTKVRLAATQFEPAYARSAFPCWDEPHYKATFQLTLSYPPAAKRIALANAEVNGELDTSDNSRTIAKFKATPIMSTYLVAFVVCDFDSTEPVMPTSTTTPTTTPLEYKVYVRPGHAAQAQYAADIGYKSLLELEKFTAIEYVSVGPKKLHLIAIPDFSAGAMENWGLITFRETGIMSTEADSTEASKESIALVIAHEQAHMWFGDLVSPAWWSYTWLNEGFARYLQYVSMNEVEPKWRLMDTFVVQTLHAAMSADSLASSHAMTATVYTPDEIQGVFDSISYDKGASVLHMTRNVMGDTKFWAALRQYLAEMKRWTANPHDLFRAFDDQSTDLALPTGVAMTTVLETWTEQAGYPVVSIRTADNGTTTVTQARFFSSESSSSSCASDGQPGQRWWVPLTFVQEGSASPVKLWLDPAESSTTIEKTKDKWIIANVNQTGFYRVNYDAANWAALAKYLQAENDAYLKVPVLNRAQVLDDALSLARAGVLDYTAALETTRYLRLEKDPIPWTAALSHLAFLRKMLVGDAAQDAFKDYMLDLMNVTYKDIGFEETQAETADRQSNHLRLKFRSKLMGQACALGYKDCVDSATAKFQVYKTGTIVAPSLRSTVYCTGAAGSQSDWDFLWSKYLQAATSPGEKSLILGALGCSRDNATLSKFLGYSLDQDMVRAQDASAVFSSVLAGGDNLDLVFKFFTDNFSTMNQRYGGWSSMQKVVDGLADRILTAEKLKELEDFLAKHNADLGVAQAAAVRSSEKAKANIAWRSKHLRTVSGWVRGHSDSASGGRGAAELSPVLLALLCALAIVRS